MSEEPFIWNRDMPPEEPPRVQETSVFYNLDDSIYLARIENALVHKYTPDLVSTFVIQSNRALREKKTNRKDSHYIFTDKDDLIRAIQSDVNGVVIVQQSTSHRSRINRPGIGKAYQRELFNEG